MKHTVPFIFLICTIFTASGQNEIRDVPKATSKIIVTTEKNSKENFSIVLNLLLDNDFEIEQKDSEFSTIKTALKPFAKTGTFYLNFRCKNNTIEITGKFYSGISAEIYGVKSEDNLEPIINKGMKGSINKNAFIEMYEVAKLFENNLSYKK